MQRSREVIIKKHKKLQTRGCKTLCCNCRLSVSSTDEPESSNSSDRFQTVSSIAHAMVQERLDQMIRDRQEARNEERIRRKKRDGTKFVVMVAMEKSSYDPREDFRESIEQMIVTNRIREAKDLRHLLNYYVKMNAEEFQGVILEKSARLRRIVSCIDKLLHRSWLEQHISAFGFSFGRKPICSTAVASFSNCSSFFTNTIKISK